jgi:hypothetical protein
MSVVTQVMLASLPDKALFERLAKIIRSGGFEASRVHRYENNPTKSFVTEAVKDYVPRGRIGKVATEVLAAIKRQQQRVKEGRREEVYQDGMITRRDTEPHMRKDALEDQWRIGSPCNKHSISSSLSLIIVERFLTSLRFCLNSVWRTGVTTVCACATMACQVSGHPTVMTIRFNKINNVPLYESVAAMLLEHNPVIFNQNASDECTVNKIYNACYRNPELAHRVILPSVRAELSRVILERCGPAENAALIRRDF